MKTSSKQKERKDNIKRKCVVMCFWCIDLKKNFIVGVESRSTRHCGHQWPIVPAPGDYDDGEICVMIGRGNRSTRRKPAPVPLCQPHTPHAARTRSRAAAVGSQRLTAWATARPCMDLCCLQFDKVRGFHYTTLPCRPKPVESFSKLVGTESLHKHNRSFINWRPVIIIAWFQKY
jgi:hypothetical protein